MQGREVAGGARGGWWTASLGGTRATVDGNSVFMESDHADRLPLDHQRRRTSCCLTKVCMRRHLGSLEAPRRASFSELDRRHRR
jgi:hypothetical protein